MSKFLLNLLLQISKALLNSKIQFLIRRFFFLAFGPADLAAHSAFGPAFSHWASAPQPARPQPPPGLGLPAGPSRLAHHPGPTGDEITTHGECVQPLQSVKLL
jgi:hypothetical protein